MGVDIYGRKYAALDVNGQIQLLDKWKDVKPAIDWDEEHSQEAKDEFFRLLSEWENSNPGYYYQNSWWGWRPIQMLCEIASEKHDLGIDFKYWGHNDNAGLETAEQCIALATALKDILETDGGFEHDTDTLYVNMGSWTDRRGAFIEQELRDRLHEEVPLGKVTFTGVMLSDSDNIYYPSHSCSKADVDRFIEFILESGGFHIG